MSLLVQIVSIRNRFDNPLYRLAEKKRTGTVFLLLSSEDRSCHTKERE